MSDKDLNMSDAFVSRLVNSTIRHIDTATDIAWPNSDFDPSGKKAWLEYTFVSADTSTDSKDSTGIVDSGFAQITIFTKLNVSESGSVKMYDRDLLEIRGDLKEIFKPNTMMEYNGTKVFVDDLSPTPAIPSESWYQSVLTINYFAP